VVGRKLCTFLSRSVVCNMKYNHARPQNELAAVLLMQAGGLKLSLKPRVQFSERNPYSRMFTRALSTALGTLPHIVP